MWWKVTKYIFDSLFLLVFMQIVIYISICQGADELIVEELQLVTDNYDEFGGLILSEWTSHKVMTAFILVEFVLIWSELAHSLFGFLTCFFWSSSLHSHGCLFLLFWLHIHLSQHQGKPSMLVEIAVHLHNFSVLKCIICPCLLSYCIICQIALSCHLPASVSTCSC